MKKPKTQSALGRGLDSLIPQGPSETLTTGITEIDIDRIKPNRYQPRERFDSEELIGLAQSIRENGIIQPVVLRPMGSEFQIVAGERRWRAAQQAGLRRVPAVIKHVSDEKLLEVALIENIQRQDLSALETAKALRLLLDEHSLTQDALAERVGMKRPTLANYLRLLSLAEPIREALDDGLLDMGHARALGGLHDVKKQAEVCKEVLAKRLSVRQVEQLVQQIKDSGTSPQKKAKPKQDPNVVAAQKRLQAALGCPAKIVRNARGAGKIEIPFRTDDELDRLFEVLLDEQQAARDAL